MTHFWEIASELKNNSTSFVVITVISSKGSAPQDPGAKAIVTEAGLHWGTIGGGKVEAKAINYSLNLLAKSCNSEPELITWNLQKDIGMSCGGEITYLFETNYSVTWSIAIFGAGHVSQALCRLLVNLNCHITCIDSRPDWLAKLPTSNNLKKIMLDDPKSILPSLNKNYYFVVMTQGHTTDLPILKELFSLYPKAPYIGTIGSKIKGLKLKKELQQFGIAENDIKKFHCPIGLSMGSNHPYEIAVSVSAQLLQVRDQWISLTSETELKLFAPNLTEML